LGFLEQNQGKTAKKQKYLNVQVSPFFGKNSIKIREFREKGK
jgi:hypothetical protein